MVRVPTNNKDALLSKTIEIENKVKDEIEKFNNSGKKPYTLDFSMGHAIYNTQYGDDVFFHNMDVEMYSEKNKHHKKHK